MPAQAPTVPSSTASEPLLSALLEKIALNTARVAIVGAGHVGLPLAVELATAGFPVLTIDSDERRVQKLRIAEPDSPDVAPEQLRRCLRSGLTITSDHSGIETCDVVVICVPTPLNEERTPDLRALQRVAEQVAARPKPGQLICVESTTYPGTTADLLRPALTRSRRLGTEVFLAQAPARIDPANPHYPLSRTPRIVGGDTEPCTLAASTFYRQLTSSVVEVRCTRTAEMVKLVENTFRAVNVALANELSSLAVGWGLDPFEVARAAATKPFGYLPFYAGPGVGGPCVPVDPLYLEWKARQDGQSSEFVRLADKVNGERPNRVIERAVQILAASDEGRSVLLYGVAYKKNVGDIRESPALQIFEGLQSHGFVVEYSDPHVPELWSRQGRHTAVPPDFARYDLVIVTTDHDALDREQLLARARRILDTRGVTTGRRGKATVHWV